ARVRFMPGVFAALAEASRRGYRLVMVADQDGLGSAAQQFILETFSSQGVDFEAVLVRPDLVQPYLREHEVEPQASAVIGDRDTDRRFAANLKVRALSVRRHGAPHETWPAALQELIARRPRPVRARVRAVLGTLSARNRRRAADRAGAAFLSLTRGSARCRAPRERDGREHSPHDRGLLQGRRPRPAPGAAARRHRAAEHQRNPVMMEAVIVESGGANLASLCYALERLGARAHVSADARTIAGAARVVLPGVGAAAHA